MGMLTNLIDRVLQASWKRVGEKRALDRDVAQPVTAGLDGPMTTRVRQFTLHEAMNGTYIEFQKRKWNQNGPDEYVRQVYIVKDDETLVDAISTVLVLTEK